MNDNKFSIFADASFDPKMGTGIIGVLTVDSKEINSSSSELKVLTKKIDNTTSGRLEIQAVIWALKNAAENDLEITIFTDYKSVVELPTRRDRLEKSNYISKRKGEILNNADLYKEFFEYFDKVLPTLVWIRGHSPSKDHTRHHELFSLVDKAVRQELRSLS
jgi:ribonuclease HI